MEKAIGIALVLALGINLLFFPYKREFQININASCVDSYGEKNPYTGKWVGRNECEKIDKTEVVHRIAWDEKSRSLDKRFDLFVLQLLITSLVFGSIAYGISKLEEKNRK